MARFDAVEMILAVSGGSGSGKTTLVRALQEAIGTDYCEIISQDNYYFDVSNIFDFDGGAVNFDHPQSIEFSLMMEHLQSLKDGESARIPTYCFKTHSRQGSFLFEPRKPILLVDGILLLSQEELLPFFDLTVFVDAEERVRFDRRLKRDVRERGRSPEGVRAQFDSQVKPMHDRFVEPSKDFADILCDGQAPIESSVEQVLKCEVLQSTLNRFGSWSTHDNGRDKFVPIVPNSHPTPV